MIRERLASGAAVLALFAIGAIILAGCGGGDDGDARMRVMLADLPMSDVSEVHVHIVRIEVVGDGGPIVLLDDAHIPDDIELTALAANPILLGQPVIPAGTFTQVRLIVSSAQGANWVRTTDGERHDLFIPSGAQTGTKLVTGQFTLDPGEVATLLLDFNAAASVHQAGASGLWIMRPTVAASVVPVGELAFGSIAGTVLDDEGQPLAVAEGEVLGVFIETPFGAIALAEVAPEDGSFEIPALLAGAYDLRIRYADLDWNPIGDPLSFCLGEDVDMTLMTLLEILLDADESIDLAIVVPS